MKGKGDFEVYQIILPDWISSREGLQRSKEAQTRKIWMQAEERKASDARPRGVDH